MTATQELAAKGIPVLESAHLPEHIAVIPSRDGFTVWNRALKTFGEIDFRRLEPTFFRDSVPGAEAA